MKKNLQAFGFFLLLSVSALAQTPIASYPLDGNAVDGSGNGFNGTINGNPVATSNRFSQTSSAMNFDGNGDYVLLPLSADFPSRTVIAWVNPAVIGTGDGINVIYACDYAAIQNGVTVLATIDDNIQGPIFKIQADQIFYETPALTNRWYQLAVTRTPSEVKIYMDGALVHSGTNPNGLHSGNGISQAVIGDSRNFDEGFIGKIDDVLIYNTALSDSAILLNYQAWRDSIVEITGKVYFDNNQNNVFDSTDQPIRNVTVNIGNSVTAITNANGDYTAVTLSGNYTITPVLPNNISAFPVSPDSIVLAADTLGRTYSGNDFGVQAPANYCDGSLAVVAVNFPPRPGFTNRINVRYVNDVSVTPINQTIEFHYPSQQSYVSATPAPTAVDTNQRTISWDINALPSGTLWQAMVTLYTPPTVAMSSILSMTAVVTTSTCATLDLPLEDNAQVIVVGSFDPNDKAVSPVGEAPGGRIVPSTPQLDYTIRFQNTGTFLAENVNIVDTISPHLNISTLKVTAASHNYQVLLDGRTVTFRFLNIMLPDSNSNEPLSHGFVKYTIEPAASFVQGTVIQNFADIYFDFNTPVRTNTVQNMADITIGIVKAESSNLTFDIFPNPLSTGSWQLVADETAVGKEIRMFDATGRQVYTSRITNQRTEIDGTWLQQGVYLVRIEGSVVRVVKL